MLLLWNSEKISVIKPKRSEPLLLTEEMIVHKDDKLVEEFRKLS